MLIRASILFFIHRFPQNITDYLLDDFDEVLKDRRFPVLQAEAKLSFASACKMEICAASAHRQNHFQARFLDEIRDNLWKSVDKYTSLHFHLFKYYPIVSWCKPGRMVIQKGNATCAI